MEFNIGDSVLITEGVSEGKICTVDYKCEGREVYGVTYHGDGYTIESRVPVEQLEYVNPNYYLITEMATVASREKNGKKEAMRIEVNPDRKRKGNPYFKVLDTKEYKEEKSRVCRLHFLDKGMEFHTGDGLLPWNITAKDIYQIKEFLECKHKREKSYTNWQIACWLWNLEYFGLGEDDIDKYMKGELNKQYRDHPSYVPSFQFIPDTWDKNFKSNKNKEDI